MKPANPQPGCNAVGGAAVLEDSQDSVHVTKGPTPGATRNVMRMEHDDQHTRKITSVTRWLALGGVVGPAVFVADWAILGIVRPQYSPIHDAISRLAELGASTRPAMTAGFIVDGL